MAGAKTFDELKAWQRAEQFRQFVSEVVARAPAARDRDFCWQIRRASRSATDNLAEGFGRYYAKEFHRYVVIARGELNEARNQLHRGFRDGILTQAEYDRGMELSEHALKTTAGLQRYLKSCIPPQAQVNAELRTPNSELRTPNYTMSNTYFFFATVS